MTDAAKQKFKKVMKVFGTVVLYICILVAVWVSVGFILMPKRYDDLGGDYYFAYKSIFNEKKDSIDVMFSGNSNTFKSCIPMEFYNATGATCYNIGGSAQSARAMEARIKNVLKNQSPKLIIIDVDCLYAQNRIFIGSNLYKILPIIAPVLYKNRWQELDFTTFTLPKDDKNFMKGYVALHECSQYQIPDDYMKSDTTEIEPLAKSVMKNVTNIYEFCQEREISLLFISAPTPATWSNEKHNGIQQLADEWGIDYLDMNMPDVEFGFDYSVHIADDGFHCNYEGSKLVTKYVTDYVNAHYSFEDKRLNEDYSNWNRLYQDYEECMANAQQSQEK